MFQTHTKEPSFLPWMLQGVESAIFSNLKTTRRVIMVADSSRKLQRISSFSHIQLLLPWWNLYIPTCPLQPYFLYSTKSLCDFQKKIKSSSLQGKKPTENSMWRHCRSGFSSWRDRLPGRKDTPFWELPTRTWLPRDEQIDRSTNKHTIYIHVVAR